MRHWRTFNLNKILINSNFSPRVIFLLAGFEMDLESYEADLADLTLQDSPFYEAATPMIFDLSMSTVNSMLMTGASMAHNGGKSMGKGAANMIENNNGHVNGNHGSHIINHHQDGATAGGGGIGANSGGNMVNNAGGVHGGYTAAFDSEPPRKKNRKCVSFLPNYVQVSRRTLSTRNKKKTDCSAGKCTRHRL